MKKIYFAGGLAFLAMGAFAQTNIQLFYDLGQNREHFTTTIEMFKSDSWGNTFFFVDYDYSTKSKRDWNINGPQSSYFEISRSINLWQDSELAPFSLQLEYNGGVCFNNPAWLAGVTYFLHSADFANTLTLELLYKNMKNTNSVVPLQLTAVWGMNGIFGVEGLNFSGFADFWWQDNVWAGLSTTKHVFVSEPQIWYNLGSLIGVPNLNAGAEIELGYNFVEEGFAANPCIGLKWNF